MRMRTCAVLQQFCTSWVITDKHAHVFSQHTLLDMTKKTPQTRRRSNIVNNSRFETMKSEATLNSTPAETQRPPCRFHLATDFVNLATRSQPMLVLRFSSQNCGLSDDQCLSDCVSQLLHRRGVFFIMRVPVSCQNQSTTKKQTPVVPLTHEPFLAEHFALDCIKHLHCLVRFITSLPVQC